MAGLSFDANQHQPDQGFELLPEGDYAVKITDSEMKPTKSGDGSYLNLKLVVMGGQYDGRVLFERLNLNNPNETAVRIAQSTLSAICHVTNVYQVSDSQQLHNIPFKVKVGVEKAREAGYNDQNRIRGYYDINGNKPGKSGGGAPAQQAGPSAPQMPTNNPAPQPVQPQQAAPQQNWQQPAQPQPQQNWQQPSQPQYDNMAPNGGYAPPVNSQPSPNNGDAQFAPGNPTQPAQQDQQYAPPATAPAQQTTTAPSQEQATAQQYQPQGTQPSGNASIEPAPQQPQAQAQPWQGQAQPQGTQPWMTPSQQPGQ